MTQVATATANTREREKERKTMQTEVKGNGTDKHSQLYKATQRHTTMQQLHKHKLLVLLL